MAYFVLFLFLFSGCSAVLETKNNANDGKNLSPIISSESKKIPQTSESHGKNGGNELPKDISKEFKVQIEDGDDEECYFRKVRKSIFETKPRSKATEVSTNCGGELKRLDILL